MCAERLAAAVVLAVALVAGPVAPAAGAQQPLPGKGLPQPAGSLDAARRPKPPPEAADPLMRTRSFEFETRATVPADAALDGPIELWIPMPVNGGYQAVTKLWWDAFGTDGSRLPMRRTIEDTLDPESGLELLHIRIPQGEHPEVTFAARFRITRRAEREGKAPDGSGRDDPQARLAPDRLGPLDGPVAELAASIPDGLTSAQIGRRAFDLVREHMSYDLAEPGWGRGDALRACALGKGDGSDYHALFLALARAKGLPARFNAGYALPAEKGKAPLAEVQCWAEFFTPEGGWIPVDVAEADRRPERNAGVFGQLTTNRVALTSGRDIRLVPPQQGEPLPQFVRTYAEKSGKPWNGLGLEVLVEDT